MRALRPGMTNRWGVLPVGMLFFWLFMAAVPARPESSLRDWNPADSIAVRYLSWNMGDTAVRPADSYPPKITFSPDGSGFFFIAHHGELATDSEVYELRVYNTAQLRRQLASERTRGATARPQWKIQFRAISTSRAGVQDPRWQPDGSGVLFMGITDAGKYRAYRLDVESGEVRPLTDDSLDLHWFESDHGAVVYGHFRTVIPQPINYPLELLLRRPDGTPVGTDIRNSDWRIEFGAARVGERGHTLGAWKWPLHGSRPMEKEQWYWLVPGLQAIRRQVSRRQGRNSICCSIWRLRCCNLWRQSLLKDLPGRSRQHCGRRTARGSFWSARNRIRWPSIPILLNGKSATPSSVSWSRWARARVQACNE